MTKYGEAEHNIWCHIMIPSQCNDIYLNMILWSHGECRGSSHQSPGDRTQRSVQEQSWRHKKFSFVKNFVVLSGQFHRPICSTMVLPSQLYLPSVFLRIRHWQNVNKISSIFVHILYTLVSSLWAAGQGQGRDSY